MQECGNAGIKSETCTVYREPCYIIIGIEGMPRRYFDYLPQFTWAQQLSTIGAYILGIGFIILIVNLFRKNGAKATANPWGGKTFEWQLPSPPPMENFTTPPTVPEKPYNYD